MINVTGKRENIIRKYWIFMISSCICIFILIYYLLQQIFINREKGFLIRKEVYGELTNYKKQEKEKVTYADSEREYICSDGGKGVATKVTFPTES